MPGSSDRKNPSTEPTARVVFLGGVGEVGRNMACVELDGRILIVDVGLSFPHAEMPGIDLVLPDFEYVRERFDDVEAVVLTHGHQDHIGALPYLLRESRDRVLPVFGTAFTLALAEGQLEEHGVRDRAEFHEVTPGEAATAGPFSMRSLRVTHSIPDGMAVVIDTPFGSILHTGDFKIDQTPLDGRPTDLHALAEEAGRGVHLLLSDSTNAEEAGYTESERSVGPVLQDIIARAPQMVVVACFSSHIHRIQQVVNAARSDERVVAFLGRSMHQSVEAARTLGLLHVPDNDVIPIEEVEARDPSRVVVICTGSQGEPYSALSLMAAREHKWVKLGAGDTVVLSSSLIPGNEPAIHRVIDGLYRTGADVFHLPAYPVHASGHAGAEELRLMLSLVRPRWFIPIHGERRHLAHHAKIATEVGVPADHVLICEDGDVVEVGEKVHVVDRAPAGMTFVDGLGIGDVGEIVLRDRRKLSADGVVVVVVAVDAHHGQVLSGPDIVNRGFVFDETSGDILEAARERVMLSLQERAEAQVVDRGVLEQNIRRTLGKYFYEVTQRKPVILPVIVEV
jgi:ribonuclease J